MRMRSAALLKAIAIVALGLFGTLAGSVAAVFLTPAGRGLAGRTLSEQLDQLVRGDVQIGAVGGPLWSGLEFDDLVIRDTTGTTVLEADHVDAHYRLFELLAGRIVLTDVNLVGPRIMLEKRRDGSWNVSRIFRGKGGRDSSVTAIPPLVRLSHVTLANGELELITPWDPADSMRTPALARLALAEERKHPGRLIESGPEGLRKRVTFKHLGGKFPLLQLSSPTHAPLRLEFDSLAASVSDPQIELRTAQGNAELDHGTLTVALDHATLPGSRLSASGTVGLNGPVPHFDLHAIAERVALRDLRGLVVGLPDLTGSAHATIRTRNDGRLAAEVSAIDLRGRDGAATGKLTAVTGANLPLALEGLDLTLTDVDLQVLRGWVDSLPLDGRFDGSVRADGPLSALTVNATVIYRDRHIPGRPANRVGVDGLVHLGGADGMRFDTLLIRESDLDLATVREIVPSIPLQGRVALEGTLSGPWRAFTWRGTALHRDGALPVSAVRGTVFLDTRGAVPRFDIDAGLMPVTFEGLRGTWPGLRASGDLRGTVGLHGAADDFSFSADLHGAPGHLAGTGVVREADGGWGFDSLQLQFDSLDLSSVAGPDLHTQLLGHLRGRARQDSAGTILAALDLTLGQGWIREVPIDSAELRLDADSAAVRIDTAFVRWLGGVATAGGALAQAGRGSGTLHLTLDAAELHVFDSLAASFVPAVKDTGLDLRTLTGRVALVATVSGALDSATLDLHSDVRDLAWRTWRVPSANADLRLGSGKGGEVYLAAQVDTASQLDWSVAETSVGLRGRRDSLAWNVKGRLGPTDTVIAGGAWTHRGDSLKLSVDSLTALLTAHGWRLGGPAHLKGHHGAWAIDSLVLHAMDGSGELRLAGVVPGDSAGALTLSALGVDLRDAMGIFQRDTIGILGRLAADIAVTGSATSPLMRGTFSLSEGGYREFRAPYVQGALDYGDHRLQAATVLWRTGREALAVDADLPLDLSLTSVTKRAIAGPLRIRAKADSADLGLLEAFTRNLRRVSGSVTADVNLTGSWGDTRMGGTVEVKHAAATLPGLGVRWEEIGARLRLAGDSVLLDTLVVHGGLGVLGAKGSIRFEAKRTPTVDLTVRSTQFRAMDVRNYLTLTATIPRLQIRGPLFGATLTGSARADQGALYFADLITKQIVNLDDPGTADLIDTALVREARLGPTFQNRFVDSLRIDTLRVTVGEDFWLRSADANVKLSGNAIVGKRGRIYRLDGTLTAERGQYSLKMGPITRDFDVDRGTVRFLGTPDLNAELDLTAHHQVKPTDGTPDMNLQARITGTLLVPKLTLVNAENPQMAETDMVSYLMFGRSASSLQNLSGAEGQRQQGAFSTGLSYFYAALSSEVERTLISDLGVPVDYIQIRPGGFGGSTIEGAESGLATVTAGWQVGRGTYVALNAGICTNVAELSYRNFGASLEQRLHRNWRATLSVEPVTTCSTAPGTVQLGTSSLYQLGLDLLWDREY